eukprot:2485845-Rhodomonas_salina.2
MSLSYQLKELGRERAKLRKLSKKVFRESVAIHGSFVPFESNDVNDEQPLPRQAVCLHQTSVKDLEDNATDECFLDFFSRPSYHYQEGYTGKKGIPPVFHDVVRVVQKRVFEGTNVDFEMGLPSMFFSRDLTDVFNLKCYKFHDVPRNRPDTVMFLSATASTSAAKK